ncbi:MAG: DUF3333 domain-containing protein, partial [Albidovulum sp.]
MTEVRADFVAKRYRSERRFRYYGAGALVVTGLFLAILLADIVAKGLPAFFEHRAIVEVMVDPAKVDAANPRAGDFDGLVKDALRARFPTVTARADKKRLTGLFSQGTADDL